MQSVSDAFSVEASSNSRQIAQSVQVAWKKEFLPSITIFTIGVSLIGGNDIIGGEAGVNTAWNKYEYQDESDNVIDINYEKNLNMPMGGVARGLFDIRFDNTSGRYIPDYMGGSSELFTAILPRRPIIINAGFHYDGIDNTIPQFIGVNRGNPEVNVRDKMMQMSGADFIEYLENKYVDNTAMFTGINSGELIENLLSQQGYSTADYELDTGINTINFTIIEKGQKLIEIIDEIVKAEYGHFYQSETGKLVFENRQHWDNAPYNEVQRIITTAEVINAETIGQDHIINVVEVKNLPRQKQPRQIIWKVEGSIELESGANELWVDFEDPILAADDPYIVGNKKIDGTGSAVALSIDSVSLFTQSAKYIITNPLATTAYITSGYIMGRPAKEATEIYVRNTDDSSQTAYEEQPMPIENQYVQSQSWAESLSQMLLTDYAEPDKLQKITILAHPELQRGDLISWQGRHWRIFGIQTTIDPTAGFIQELTLLQRNIVSYFRIGISTIGGTDQIAP